LKGLKLLKCESHLGGESASKTTKSEVVVTKSEFVETFWVAELLQHYKEWNSKLVGKVMQM
jgi:hypothetical protein